MRSQKVVTSSICIFCEDIREEKAGSSTLVGVFGDIADVDSLPSILPKLAMYFRVVFETRKAPLSISIMLELPWQEEKLNFGEIPKDKVEQAVTTARSQEQSITSITGRIMISPFNIPAPGRIIALASIDNEVIQAGSLNFQVPQSKIT